MVKISNVEQNKIYEEEKRRVWDLQWSALSNPVPPVLSTQDEDHDRVASTPVGLGPRFGGRSDSKRSYSRGNSMAATPIYGRNSRERSSSAFSGDGESTYTGNPNTGKVMRIKRVVSG